MKEPISLLPISDADESEFLHVAEAYFKELNPAFVAQEDWKRCYFAKVRTGEGVYARWIYAGPRRAGFVIYGWEPHRFLPRTNGWIYELYLCPSFRRMKVGERVVEEVIELLREFRPSKIQLEVACRNLTAVRFWRSLGFEKVSERFVLKGRQK